jgi:hypothetical protein
MILGFETAPEPASNGPLQFDTVVCRPATTGSRMVQISTRVGISVNGSRNAEAGSGMTSMSLFWVS